MKSEYIDLRDLVGRDLNHSGKQTMRFLSLLWGLYPEFLPNGYLQETLGCSREALYQLVYETNKYLQDDRHPLHGEVMIVNKPGFYGLQKN